MTFLLIFSANGNDRLRDAAARYLRLAVDRWGIANPTRLEAGLEGIGIAADIEASPDGSLTACVLPLAEALADESPTNAVA